MESERGGGADKKKKKKKKKKKCFEQKCEKYQNLYLKFFILLVVKFSVYLNRRVFVMVVNFITAYEASQ